HVGVALVNNKIYTFGGFVKSVHSGAGTDVFEYDPATDTWKDAAPMSKARDHMATVVAEGKIHVIGGRFTSPVDRTDMHEVYDPATNSWSTAAPLKTPRSAVAAALYRGMIVVDGGEWPPENRTFTENEGYDPKTNSWASLAPMP